MKRDTHYLYQGGRQASRPPCHPDAPQEPEPYVAAPELIQAVNLAIYLRRPLLLEGEAGCGKTRLARAVAYELGLPFYPWYVRSTSKAQEGFYQYDAILRLHDIHTRPLQPSGRSRSAPGSTARSSRTGGDAGNGQTKETTASPAARDPGNPMHYRRFGPLGKAFQLRDCPAVVLIDEIDKAELDFPNDLLAVLDHPWEFRIPETNEIITASQDCLPIVIVTSNKEKGNLPAPFLRRCLYYYMDFPEDPERLREIVEAHYAAQKIRPPAQALIRAASKRFIDVRTEGSLYKKPGTSEFLDWMEALRSFEAKPYGARTLAGKGPLPYPELLFKLRADFQRYTTPSP